MHIVRIISSQTEMEIATMKTNKCYSQTFICFNIANFVSVQLQMILTVYCIYKCCIHNIINLY